MEKYICIEDRLGGDFHVGDVQTVDEWREWVKQMDEYEYYSNETKQELDSLKGKELIELIDHLWDITLVKKGIE